MADEQHIARTQIEKLTQVESNTRPRLGVIQFHEGVSPLREALALFRWLQAVRRSPTPFTEGDETNWSDDE